MKILDVNLLLYATDTSSRYHERCSRWLNSVLASGESVGIPWVVALGFIRIASNPKFSKQPVSVQLAAQVVQTWYSHPAVEAIGPRTPDANQHVKLVLELLAEVGGGHKVVTDAHLAAVAIENNAEMCSHDGVFRQFAKLRHLDPLA